MSRHPRAESIPFSGRSTLLSLAFGLAACSSSTAPPSASDMAAVAGTSGQSAVVNTAVAIAPAVKVTSSGGTPIGGMTVTFAVSAGGGSVGGGSAVTNSAGIATVTSWTLGTTAGANSLTASATGVPNVVITATGTPGAAATLTVTPASFDVLPAGTLQLSVTVVDAFGNALTGPAVTFTPASTLIATSSSSGLVTGVAVGSTAISVASGAANGSTTAFVLGHPGFTTLSTTAETGRPFGIAISSSSLVYVTELDNGRVGQYQLPSQTLSGTTIAVGSVPTSVTFLPNGTRAYVANLGDSVVSVIDVATHAVITTVKLSGKPLRVLASPDGNTVYATTDAGTLEFIATATNTTSPDTLALGAVFNGVALSPTQSLVYVSSTTNGHVYEVNTATRASRSFNMGGTPQDIAVSHDGSTLYIANETGPMEVRDAATLNQTTTVALATDVFGLTITPDGTQLYATIANTLTVLATSGLTVAHSSAQVGALRRIAFDHLGTTGAVASEGGSVIFVQ